MKEILDDVRRWREQGEQVAVATVIATRRSAPRPVGASLAVSASGQMCGSVSGGCVESDVYEHAREVLETGTPKLLSYGIADEEAWAVGLPCGGEIDVYVAESPPDFPRETLEAERAVLFSVVDGALAGRWSLSFENGDVKGDGVPDEAVAQFDELIRGGRNRLLELSDGTKVFAEWYGPPPRLLVYGAVDTAEALCRAAGLLGWHTIVADARAKFATRERIPSADELIVAWPEEALAQVAPDHQTAIVVLTHDDKFDEPALKGALETEAFYIGALGSRRNQERRRGRLLEAGVAEEELDRISGPCGLDLGADSQSETALSILAEILAVRAGRSGGPLKTAKQRIHAEV
ncbi:MAG: XdhC family protein [Actinobacteria bacterium]|nr:XdhC family protein [Actinomycetota bacterium]